MTTPNTFTIPTGWDIVAWKEDSEHLAMAVHAEKGHTPAVPWKNAGTALAALLCERWPKDFQSRADAEAWFLMTHMRNMHAKENSAGQPYPVALEAPTVAVVAGVAMCVLDSGQALLPVSQETRIAEGVPVAPATIPGVRVDQEPWAPPPHGGRFVRDPATGDLYCQGK